MNDVEVRNATKKFGEIVAVDNVSFQVNQREFLTLLGPSGCGKTTMLRLISGLDRLTSGEIFICQENVTDAPPYARDLSLMFQNYALFPHKNILDNIGFGLKYRERGISKSEREKRVYEVLELVGLPGIEQRYPRQLSGGQQQRVALARALVIKPTVLLLDEPFSNLDLKLRERMRVELKQIQEQIKITFIFVTHDQDEALMLSDRIALMDEGRIIQLDTPRIVYEKPKSRFVAEFIGQSNFLEGRIIHSNRSIVELEMENGLTLHVFSDHEVTIGRKGVAQIRAERIQIHHKEPPPSGMNIFSGKLERTIYLGSSIQQFVRLRSNDLIMAFRPAISEEPLSRGSTVWVAFATEDCQLLQGK